MDVVNQIGRTDDGTDTDGYYNSEFFVPLRPQKDWPAVVEQEGWRRWLYGPKRPRTKEELIAEMDAELERKLPGVTWNFSQNIRDNVMEALSGIKGDNSLKIIGPDFNRLQDLGTQAKNIMQTVPGLEDVGLLNIQGQSHLEFRPDPEKCQRWGVQVADVNNVAASALGGQAVTQMIEGEKRFDVSIRWPAWRRGSETSILDIPVDVGNNQVVQPQGPGFVPSATGTGQAPPAVGGSLANTANPLSNTPRLRLRDLVSPVGEDGAVDPNGQFEKPGAAVIYREQAKRLIAVKFSVRGRDLAGAVDEARKKTQHLFKPPYRAVWSGEFEEMQDAETRLMWIIPLSLGLIFILLYSALRSWLDAVVVLSNVLAMADGRRLGLVPDRHQLQHFGGRRLHFALRRRHYGRAAADLLLQHAAIAGSSRCSKPLSRGPQTRAPGDDDRLDGLVRIVAGGPFDANRFADPAAAGHRRGRRHGHDVLAHPLSHAGAVQFLRPSRTPGGGRQFGTLRRDEAGIGAWGLGIGALSQRLPPWVITFSPAKQTYNE